MVFKAMIAVMSIASTSGCSAWEQANESHDLLGCSFTLTILDPASTETSRQENDFQKQVEILFDTYSAEQINKLFKDTKEGSAMIADPLFDDPGSAWRLSRPIAIPDDPDGFYDEPEQSHLLFRPTADSAFESLVFVGIDQEGGYRSPAFAGRLKNSGKLFTLEPNNADTCVVRSDDLTRTRFSDTIDGIIKM